MKETLRLQYIRCGKRNCRSCPHGPYWYAFWSEKGKTRSRYVGKVHPDADPRAEPRAEGQRYRTPEPEPEKPHPWDAMFNQRTANLSLAWEVFGMRPTRDLKKFDDHFKAQVQLKHPDKGGDKREAQWLVAAWSYLKACVRF